MEGYFMKKRIVTFAILAVMAAGLCTGCGSKLPEGFDADVVTQKATEVVQYLTDRNYQAIEDVARQDVKEALNAGYLEEVLDSTIVALGAFEEISAVALAGVKGQSQEEYAAAVVIAVYENGKAQYTLSFDIDMALVGLYMK
jgi:predicted small lipoprotein YifL